MQIKIGYNNGCGSNELVALVDKKIVATFCHFSQKWEKAKRYNPASGWCYPPADINQNNLWVANTLTIDESVEKLNKLDLKSQIYKLANGSDSFTISENGIFENDWEEYGWTNC